MDPAPFRSLALLLSILYTERNNQPHPEVQRPKIGRFIVYVVSSTPVARQRPQRTIKCRPATMAQEERLKCWRRVESAAAIMKSDLAREG